MSADVARLSYRPSGGFSAVGILITTFALFVAALVLGLALAFTGQWIYLIVVSPGIAAGLLGGIAYALLRWSHCRSPMLAMLMAGAGGAALYILQFPGEIAVQGGWGVYLRPDIWPGLIYEIVNAWQIGKPGGNAGNAWPLFNWGLFLFEFIFAIAVAGGIGASAAAPSYCERCKKWMTKKSVVLPPESANAVVAALAMGSIAALPSIEAKQASGDHAILEVEGCSHGGLDSEAVFYLTAREVRGSGESMTTIIVLQQSLLTPDEFIALVEKCPSLAGA